MEWTKEEDAALMQGVDRHGHNWTAIRYDQDYAGALNDRGTSAMLGRYNILTAKQEAGKQGRGTDAAGNKKRKHWTADEIAALKEGYQKYGDDKKKWSKVKKDPLFSDRLKDRQPKEMSGWWGRNMVKKGAK